jgi:ribosomal protein L11 methyltransferase
MKWIEIEISTSSEAADAVGEKLLEAGATGISVQDPDELAFHLRKGDAGTYALEEYQEGFDISESTKVKGYFASPEKGICLCEIKHCTIGELVQKIKTDLRTIGSFLDIGKASIASKTLDDEDWAHSWKKYYHPIRISPRGVIVPSWETYKPRKGERIIYLDPGSAFGTGDHATTALCAEMVDEDLSMMGKRFADRKIPEGTRMLDLGCGSGILSILAGTLGMPWIDAVDIDETAVRVAKENIRLNLHEHQIHCFRGEISDLTEYRYDMIVANIIADVIFSIAPDIFRLLLPDGIFIASGIINTKSDRIDSEYQKLGFERITRAERNDWVAFRFVKRI